MKEFLDVVLPIVSLMIGAIGTFMGVRSFYRERQQEALKRHAEAERKEYAAQRDFGHLQRNYEQFTANLANLVDECDRRFDEQALELKEVKGLLNVVIMKLSGDNTSAVHRYQPRNES